MTHGHPAPHPKLHLIDGRYRQGVVVAVADAAHGRLDAGLGKALGILDGQVLAASVAMMDQPHALGGAAFVNSLLQGIEDEAGVRRSC